MMGMLLPLAGLFLSGSVHHKIERTKRNAVFVVIALLLFATAYVFALAALAAWLSILFGPIAGLAVVAVGAVVLGVLVLIIMTIVDRARERRARERELAMQSATTVGLGLLRTQPVFALLLGGALLGKRLLSRKID